ncbi:MAG: transcriptional regulator [Chlorogloeopsis fritschii C42_A2020_084]|jgi:DNA-binding phage protein|uniref:helix-turn-helix domain-containing transcriptional regulator n=1 Tax=Chlorogloeopsis fritschii TaxID=1124 RepID=UPI0019DAEA74|nr:transcriptional regulator [Chlorogloeopsis fritschii]MBF2004907.1 transcriptional regulator [Chlorogloeopsis fritschii C42_A2020_084]
MKEVKTPTSSSYHDYLISSLKDPEHAAAYIGVMLELEEGREPELLGSALKDIIEARLLSGNLSEEAKHHYEKLDKILSETGGNEIYTLIEFLDALGYRIAIAPKD